MSFLVCRVSRLKLGRHGIHRIDAIFYFVHIPINFEMVAVEYFFNVKRLVSECWMKQ